MEFNLLRRIERFIRRTGTTATGFGRSALRDPRLVADLRRGRILRPETQLRIRDYLDEAEKLAEQRPCRRRRR